METEAWLHFFGQHDASVKDGLARALTHTGVKTRALAPTTDTGWGILCFCEFSDGLCELLYEVSQRGMERILAVAVSGAGLTHEHIWQLLQAGAFVQTIEARQGQKVGSPEEVAFHMGYINGAQLRNVARRYLKSGYGQYLERLACPKSQKP